jgi:hypothetical protein
MRYVVINADGFILRRGNCPENALASQAGVGEVSFWDIHDDTDDTKHRYVNAERVAYTPPVVQLPIAAQRAIAMPLVGDQLDALWHAMDDKVLPMVPAFYDPIKAVKDSLPKGTVQ